MASTTLRRGTGTTAGNVAWMVLGYFLAYIPYAILAKATSSGYLPGVGAHGGLQILPAAAIGQLLVMPVFLVGSGWWRYGTRRVVLGRRVFFPQPSTLLAGVFTALIIGTTTLNFTFPGVSVVFMLLMMRALTLTLSPLSDRATGRKVQPHSWAAVALSLLGVALALTDVAIYALTLGAVLSLAVYFAGYVGRFTIMGRTAKTGVLEADRRYLVGEHAAAAVFQVAILALCALLGQSDLQKGFSTLLSSPATPPALAIGVFYEILFVFGTSIYLHRNEYSWAVPLNRGSSLFSGVVASFTLAALTPLAVTDLPGPGQLLALVAVTGALTTACLPVLKRLFDRSSSAPRPRVIIFVCGGNTCRSPMAEAIAKEELAIARAGHMFRVGSAGVSVRTVGEPMTPEAIVALGESGIEVRHRTRPLTAELCRSADVIYCMTGKQREAILALAPDVDQRTFCLDPDADIFDPIGQPIEVYRELAARLRALVRARLAEQAQLDGKPA